MGSSHIGEVRMRTRTKGGYTTTTYERRGGSGNLEESVVSNDALCSYKTITDVSTPNFIRLRNEGHVLMNPLSIEQRTRSFSGTMTFGPVPLTGGGSWGPRTLSGPICHVLAPAQASPAYLHNDALALRQECINEVYAKLNSSDAQALVTMVEARKTASMLQRPFGSVMNLLGEVANRKLSLVRKGFSASKAFSSAWLEYRFGWKPLLYDIDNICKATAYLLVNQANAQRVILRSKSRSIDWSGKKDTPTLVAGLSYCNFSSTKFDRYKLSAGIVADIHPAMTSDMIRNHFGLQLSDVPSTIWELVPFSFVVDRFVNVGQWLSAMRMNPEVSIRGTWATTERFMTESISVADAYIDVVDFPKTTRVRSGGANSTHIYYRKDRDVGVSPSVLPVWNHSDLSFSQLVDHSALIMQKLTRL